MVKRILVTGGRGRLAGALARCAGDRIITLGRDQLDITQPGTIAEELARLQPDLVVNTAATSSVDEAELRPAPVYAVNAVAPGLLAQACALRELPLIHLSTDYVFGAATKRPWREDDTPSPINAYGRMKLEGERRVRDAHPHARVVRVAWLFGDGKDFISNLLRANRSGSVMIAADQIGSPTPIDPLAYRLVEFAERIVNGEPGLPPVLHLAGTPPVDRATWVETAFEALKSIGREAPTVVRVSLDDLPSSAPRPRFSALDCTLSRAIFGTALDWRPLTEMPETFDR